MALTLQRKLELAGALSKVSAIALAAVVAAGVLRRRGGSGDGLPEMDGGLWTGFPEPDAFAAEPDGMS